ncbi:MAG: aldo/keto reductase [Actinomycetota bacterium]|nr:aldo/keto reductase [Actinomycetota bacterium]
MEHRGVGNSGLQVSVFGMGTMTFGAESDEAASGAMLDRFADAGGTLIDTADVYTAGVSEEIVGRWLAKRSDRNRFVVATKGRFSAGHDPGFAGASRAHLTNAVDASLRRLQTDVIDLYQVHCWDPHTPLEETLEALTDMVREGKVRHVGVSNFTGYQLARAAATARLEGLTPIVSLQAQYSLLERTIELDLVPACMDEGVGILPWSPLGGGWLTGKYSSEQEPTGASRLGEDPTRGVEAYQLRNTERTWAIIEECAAVASTRDVPLSSVALTWLRDRPSVSSVILGTRTVEQLDQNLLASDLELSVDERAGLDRASAPGIPLYPYGFIEKYGGDDVWERLATRNEPPPIGA